MNVVSFEKVIKGSIRPVNMKSIAFQMTKILHERMTNVAGWLRRGRWRGGGEVVHTKSMGKTCTAR